MMNASPTHLSSKKQPEQSHSTIELLKNLFGEFRFLIEQHIELGKTELREEVSQLKQGTILCSGGALIGQLSLLFLGLAFMFFIALYLPFWSAALMLGIFFALISLTMLLMGRHSLEKARRQRMEMQNDFLKQSFE